MRRVMPITAVASALLATFAIVISAAPATATTSTNPVVRWASPGGSEATNAPCTKQTPCGLITAINNAPSDSEVFVEKGNYGSNGAAISTTLTTGGNTDVTIRGADPRHPPVIYTDASDNGFQIDGGSTLSDAAIISDAGSTGLYLGGMSTGSDVAVVASNGVYGACSIYGTLLNSLCLQTDDGESAIAMGSNASETSTIRGVTAISAGSGGIGIKANIDGTGTFDVDVTNSIIKGATTDVEAGSAAGGVTTITLDHSDFKTAVVQTASPGTTINSGAGDIKALPKFVDPSLLNFTESAGSPTIDAGTADPSGETALGRNPRTLGSHPDMGAYEFAPNPGTPKLKVTKVGKHSAQLKVTVNPEGLATKVEVVAKRSGKTITSHAVSAGSKRKPTAVKLRVAGLKSASNYTLHAQASDKAGTTVSAPATLRTTGH